MQFSSIAVEVGIWLYNYIPQKTIIVITYPCHHLRQSLLANGVYVVFRKQVKMILWRITYNVKYHKTSDISRTLFGNKIVDNSDVVGASPVGAAPTTSSFST